MISYVEPRGSVRRTDEDQPQREHEGKTFGEVVWRMHIVEEIRFRSETNTRQAFPAVKQQHNHYHQCHLGRDRARITRIAKTEPFFDTRNTRPSFQKIQSRSTRRDYPPKLLKNNECLSHAHGRKSSYGLIEETASTPNAYRGRSEASLHPTGKKLAHLELWQSVRVERKKHFLLSNKTDGRAGACFHFTHLRLRMLGRCFPW